MKQPITLWSVFFILIFAGPLHACQEGDYWVFKIERKSSALSTSRDINGTYKVQCSQSTLTADNGDTQYFSDTVPSVPGITEKPPWFRNPIKVGDTWNYEYSYSSDNRRQYTVSGIFKVESKESKTVQAGSFDTFKLTRIDTGHRAGKRTHTYYFSPKAGGVVAADIEYQSGTTYKMELLEYKNTAN
jgi:hypothetical protein